jgi:hypothetical protein
MPFITLSAENVEFPLGNHPTGTRLDKHNVRSIHQIFGITTESTPCSLDENYAALIAAIATAFQLLLRPQKSSPGLQGNDVRNCQYVSLVTLEAPPGLLDSDG